jgi:RNA polymerase sigma-70 factor (ECF subfamily)
MSPNAGVRVAVFPCEPQKLERFCGIVHQQKPLVERRLRRLGVPDADVDDAVQDVFVVLARRLDDVERERERAFVLGTVARVASMRKRTRRRHPEEPSEALDEQPATSVDPEALDAALLAEDLVHGLLARLRTESRAVIMLAELEELPLRDVAARLGIPLGTVNSRLRRARAELRGAVVRMRARERGPRPARDLAISSAYAARPRLSS